MTTFAAKLLDQGIRLRSYEARNHKVTCPR